MTPSKIRSAVVAERVAWIREMLAQLRTLPLDSLAAFESDARNPAAAESYLRRGLEALLDLGRHVLSKGFGRVTTEYKEIAEALCEVGVLDQGKCKLLREMAGYRNRMVHFYSNVTRPELYQICTQQLSDVESVLDAILRWIREHPERTDTLPGE
jgi:uncharacterized protein YutE (UPF0331/DUF86 family)